MRSMHSTIADQIGRPENSASSQTTLGDLGLIAGG